MQRCRTWRQMARLLCYILRNMTERKEEGFGKTYEYQDEKDLHVM